MRPSDTSGETKILDPHRHSSPFRLWPPRATVLERHVKAYRWCFGTETKSRQEEFQAEYLSEKLRECPLLDIVLDSASTLLCHYILIHYALYERTASSSHAMDLSWMQVCIENRGSRLERSHRRLVSLIRRWWALYTRFRGRHRLSSHLLCQMGAERLHRSCPGMYLWCA